MKKKILVLSGVAVTGMGIAALIIKKGKKKTNSEIDFLEADDFDDDPENDDDEMDDPWDVSTDEDDDDLGSLTDEELDQCANELINEFERRCRAELEGGKRSQEEAGCRSR